MTSIMCSTGAFSRDPDLTSPKDIIATAKRISCDGLELIFYPDWYDSIDSIEQQFKQSGVNWRILHTEKSIGPLLGTGASRDAAISLDRLRVNCELANALGIHSLVLHLWGLPDSDTNINANISQLEKCLTMTKKFNLELMIETIPCVESTPLDVIRKIVSEFPDITVTLDTEFLAMHEELDIALTDPLVRKATKHVHIKDYDGEMRNADGSRRYLHPGEGTIDFAWLLREVMSFQQKPSICLESTSVQRDGHIDIARIRNDLSFLHRTRTFQSLGT